MRMNRPPPPHGFRVRHSKRCMAYALALPLLLLRLAAWIRNHMAGHDAPRSVIILEPCGMGDVVTHEPLVRVLRESGHDVTFCSRPPWRGIIPEHGSVRWQDIGVPWAAAAFAEKYRISLR